jgi:hypothetical protein
LRPTSSRQLSNPITNSLIIITTVIITLVCLEIGARWLPPPYQNATNPGIVCSEQLGWRGRSNYEATLVTDGYQHPVRFNERGMHDREHPQLKPEGTYRILMLGDSFVQAAQVAETETARQILEDLLNSRPAGRRYEVINAGIPSWGAGQELIYYRQEGRSYQPDLVLLVIYIGNDIKDNLPGRALTIAGRNCYAPYLAVCDHQLDPTPLPYAPGLPPVEGECSASYKFVANMLGKLYRSSHLYARLEPLLAAGQPDVNALDYYHLYLPQEDDELFGYAWQLILGIVKQLDREVRQDGAEFAVVLVSPREVLQFTQMSEAEREVIYQMAPDLRQATDLDRPNRKLIEALAEDNIRVLDLFPLFASYMNETGQSLYYSGDNHWNVTGNRVAAEMIYAWLPKDHAGIIGSSK